MEVEDTLKEVIEGMRKGRGGASSGANIHRRASTAGALVLENISTADYNNYISCAPEDGSSPHNDTSRSPRVSVRSEGGEDGAGNEEMVLVLKKDLEQLLLAVSTISESLVAGEVEPAEQGLDLISGVLSEMLTVAGSQMMSSLVPISCGVMLPSECYRNAEQEDGNVFILNMMEGDYQWDVEITWEEAVTLRARLAPIAAGFRVDLPPLREFISSPTFLSRFTAGLGVIDTDLARCRQMDLAAFTAQILDERYLRECPIVRDTLQLDAT